LECTEKNAAVITSPDIWREILLGQFSECGKSDMADNFTLEPAAVEESKAG